MTDEERIKKAYELGFEYEREYYGCSQCTVAAVSEALEVRNDFIFKAASGFAGGMGSLCSGPCGGYTGGAMMVSAFFGRVRERFDDDIENRRSSYRLVRRLADRFFDAYGSFVCEKVQRSIFGRSFNILDPEERAAFEKAGAHTDKCPSVVGNAASWTCELILEEMRKKRLDLDHFRFLRQVASDLY
ncbi:MAG: C_GCAxxG_C_C family protein [Spirochaetes bacterium]|nr:C_GCAxxG_C_C family protein [Spirochaetota bacterium]